MYCVNCGVKLGDTEKKCPLCQTRVYHPDLQQPEAPPLYPADRLPKTNNVSKVFNGGVIIVYFIPLLLSFFADLQSNGRLDWFGFVAGGLMVSYTMFALPFWFRKPNPVIFVPCSFGAVALYLLYIDLVTSGSWFLSFALPVTSGLCLIVSAAVTLLYYLPGGKLYVLGGVIMAFGAFLLLVEFLMDITFHFHFIGWSVYPMIVFLILGGLGIYCSISKTAREILERKLFF